jgi:hypothetical protein
MVTTTLCPVSCIVTRTFVPKGSVACAAVISFSLKIVPLLVRRPLWRPPYQLASPLSSQVCAPCAPWAAGAPCAWAGPVASSIDAMAGATAGRKRTADLIIRDLVFMLMATLMHFPAPQIKH